MAGGAGSPRGELGMGRKRRGEVWNSNGNAKRKLRARLKAEGRPCHLCGQPIDYDLPAGDPWSFELDHIVPLARGGNPYDYDNAAASHRICNERKGCRMPQDQAPLTIRRSRLW